MPQRGAPVDLHVRAADLEDVVVALLRAHLGEDLRTHDGQDALVDAVADKGVALACTRLPVSEHRTVVALQSVLKHGCAEVLVDHLLARVLRTWPGAGFGLRDRVGVRVRVRPLALNGTATQQAATTARQSATSTPVPAYAARESSLLHTPWPLFRPCRCTELTRARD